MSYLYYFFILSSQEKINISSQEKLFIVILLIISNLVRNIGLRHEKTHNNRQNFSMKKLLVYHKKNNFVTKQQSFTLNKYLSCEEKW